MSDRWIDLGAADELKKRPVQEININGATLALSYLNGEFCAIDGLCIHAEGPLGEGTLEDEAIVCPLHEWKFHRKTGKGYGGTPGQVPCFNVEVRDGRVFVERP